MFKKSLKEFPSANKEKVQGLLKKSSECAAEIAHAEKLIVKKVYEEAITKIEKVLEVAVNSFDLRLSLCRLLMETKQWERLIQSCSTLLRTRSAVHAWLRLLDERRQGYGSDPLQEGLTGLCS